MKFPFRSPVQSYAAPAPETPYQRARQEWDARMGSAVLSARAWRATAFAALALAAALGLALTLVALQKRTFVHVVEVAPEGQVLTVRAADGDWTPSKAQSAWFAGQFVRLVRARPADAVVLRENWLAAYALVTPEAAQQLNEVARAEDPFANAGTGGRSVHVRSVVQRSAQTWQVSWREQAAGPGQAPIQANFTGLFTLRHDLPRTAADIAANPLGLRVTDFSWSRDQ